MRANRASWGAPLFAVALSVASVLAGVPAEACLTAPLPQPNPTPIYISSNEDFKTNPAVSGGSGVPEDPYRIENLVTNPAARTAISISGTTAAFLIRNVTVTSNAALTTSRGSCCYAGIVLSSVSNGTVDRVTTEGTQYGIEIGYSDAVTVRASHVKDSYIGIYVRESTRVGLSGNTLENATIQIDASTEERSSSHTIPDDNTIDGQPFYFRSQCSGLTVADRTLGGAVFASCSGLTLRNLTLPSSGVALRLFFTKDASLDGVATSMRFENVERASVRRATVSTFSVDNFKDIAIETSVSPPDKPTAIIARNGSFFRVASNDFHGGAILHIGDYPRPSCYCDPHAPQTLTVTDAVVADNTLRDGGGFAVELVNAPGAKVIGNRILNHSGGIRGGSEPGIVIQDNHLEGAGGSGIDLASAGASVFNNTLTGFGDGVSLSGDVHAEVVGNHIEAVNAGIRVGDNSWPLLSANQLVGGAIIVGSSRALVSDQLEVGPNNTVNGLPVAFHHRESDLDFEGAALGELILIECENVTISNVTFKDVSTPMILAGVANFSIDHLAVDNATLGITLQSVWMGRLSSSRLNHTGPVEVYDAQNLTFEDNVVTNGSGFTVWGAGGIEFLNNRIEGGVFGALGLLAAYEVTLKGNAFTGSGVQLYGTSLEEFRSHDIDSSNTVDGRPLIYLRDGAGALIEGQSIGQLIVANCSDVRVSNVNAQGGSPALTFAFSTGVRLSNVTAAGSVWQVLFAYEVEGLRIEDSRFALESADPIEYGGTAVSLSQVKNATLARVDINSSGVEGLSVSGSSNISIVDSSLRGAWYGVELSSSTRILVSSSSFRGGYGGLVAFGLKEATVTRSTFGQGFGVSLNGVSRVDILDNRFADLAYAAINIDDSGGVRVVDNRVTNASVGISVTGRPDGIGVEGNSFQRNREGIHLEVRGAANLTFFNNTVEGNGVGVAGNISVAVMFYHNRFLNNTVQARVSPGGSWDAGYLVGGNFWSDYGGLDKCSGPDQDVCPDPDEFGDTAYCLGGFPGFAEASDRYPLMNPTPPPARQPPPLPVEPPKPTTLDPTVVGVSTVALILVAVAAGIFLSMRRKPVERLEDDEIERLS